MSILVNNVSDTIINIFMIIAMIVGFFQLRHLKIDHLEVILHQFFPCVWYIIVIFGFTVSVGFLQCDFVTFQSSTQTIKNNYKQLFQGELDIVMIITAFGIFVYSTFTIIAGCLNDDSYEPGQLVVANGIVELLEVKRLLQTKLKV